MFVYERTCILEGVPNDWFGHPCYRLYDTRRAILQGSEPACPRRGGELWGPEELREAKLQPEAVVAVGLRERRRALGGATCLTLLV